MEIRPDRGGRIASLRLDGEELLDRGIGIDEPQASGFVEAGAWGWDEMVPNVAATNSLPDHGEAWRLPWFVVESSVEAAAMTCSGRALPWTLERSIELRRSVVSISYRYTNRGAVPLAAYWCAHPLFRFEAGMEIGVPGGERLAQLPEGSSTKMFLARGSVDRAALRWGSGAAVELGWDRELTPYVGVWVCNGDLGGYRQVAIEPATGGNDRPDPAAPPPLLEPGGTFEWWMEVRDARVMGSDEPAGPPRLSF
jgi:galactose mutarotase-like enzyme